jgi:hypothetical protein
MNYRQIVTQVVAGVAVAVLAPTVQTDTIYVDDDNGFGSDVTIIDAQGVGSVVTSAHSEGPDIELEGSTTTGGTGVLFGIPPDVPPCCAYADPDACRQGEAGCTWLVDGCGFPNVSTGCYPFTNCLIDDCPPDHDCFYGNIDPCPGIDCGECGVGVFVCAYDMGIGVCQQAFNCDEDINGDLHVNILDFLGLLAQWGPCPQGCPADINNDGFVDLADFDAMVVAWGPCWL